jgi:hypothetical protein
MSKVANTNVNDPKFKTLAFLQREMEVCVVFKLRAFEIDRSVQNTALRTANYRKIEVTNTSTTCFQCNAPQEVVRILSSRI